MIHFIERVVNTLKSHPEYNQKVSKALIEKIKKLCLENKIHFVLAGIASDRKTLEMLNYFNSRGTLVTDISLSNKSGIFSNDPYDGHPNAYANSYYANKLYNFLIKNKLITAEEMAGHSGSK